MGIYEFRNLAERGEPSKHTICHHFNNDFSRRQSSSANLNQPDFHQNSAKRVDFTLHYLPTGR